MLTIVRSTDHPGLHLEFLVSRAFNGTLSGTFRHDRWKTIHDRLHHYRNPRRSRDSDCICLCIVEVPLFGYFAFYQNFITSFIHPDIFSTPRSSAMASSSKNSTPTTMTMDSVLKLADEWESRVLKLMQGEDAAPWNEAQDTLYPLLVSRIFTLFSMSD